MDSKRFILALVLSIAVIFVVQTVFPSSKPLAPTHKPGTADSVAAASNTASSTSATNATQSASVAAPSSAAATTATTAVSATPNAPVAAATAIKPETTFMSLRTDSGATFALSNIGAAPVAATMNFYKYATQEKLGQHINLGVTGQSLIKYHILTNKKQQIDLNTVPFTETEDSAKHVVTYQGTAADMPVTFAYTFAPDGHTVHVAGTVNTLQNGYLLIDLPQTLPTTERDTMSDYNALAYAYLSTHDGARNVLFRSLDPGEDRTIEGPLSWVATKTKYFVVGILAPVKGTLFEEARLEGGPRTSKIATRASATVVLPVANGTFAFDLYAGPQEWKRLNALGRDFDEVNPYGWAFFRGLLQPIATGVIRLVIWMHQRLNLGYGLVLIVLGIFVRVILWPLNQSAMRTSLKMQELQPKIQAVQAKYKDEPEKQRTEVMKVYSEHGMSPLSPLTGCLPMFLPMPVLLALFFVFQNTIEFRGVSFLWLHDLSSRDPYYILPVIMAISMFLLSWIGMRNAPPNPQSKMMSYMMPAMFLLFLGRAAAGLNLYYAAQNLAALPQQWMLIKDREKSQAQRGLQPQKSS